MTQDWFRTAFGAEYTSLYEHRNEAEANAMADLIIQATTAGPGTCVLDAPCGAGRHVRAFASRGAQVVGLDLSRELLDSAAAAHPRHPGTVHYLRCDIRHIPLRPAQFDLVTNLFSSFGYFETEAENFEVTRNLASMARPGGHLVIDFMNADYVERNLQPHSERITASGWHVQDERWISKPPQRINKRTLAQGPQEQQREFFESVRMYTRAELEDMMAQAGVQVERCFGDYAGNAWDEDSSRVFLIGRKQ